MLAPNDLWCADFKGEFKTGDGIYCFPLTVTDQHSRFLLGCQALHSTRVAEAKPVFTRLFCEYGLLTRLPDLSGEVWLSASELGILGCMINNLKEIPCMTTGCVDRVSATKGNLSVARAYK